MKFQISENPPDKPAGFRIGVLIKGEKIVNFAVLKQMVLTIIKVNPVKIKISNGAKITKESKYENGRRKKESEEIRHKLRQDE